MILLNKLKKPKDEFPAKLFNRSSFKLSMFPPFSSTKEIANAEVTISINVELN